MRLRGFVPVDELTPEPPPDAPPPTDGGAVSPARRERDEPPRVPPRDVAHRAVPRRLMPDGADEWEKRVSLFGEADL
jgi:hypothetical protein